jgi:hypothetical protein
MTSTTKARVWPIDQRTDFELRDLRAELETKLATLPAQSPDHTVFSGRLTEVVTEQESRRAARNAPWDDDLTP